VGTSQYGQNSGSHQRRSPHLGKGIQTYWTCTSVHQALKNQIISVFEPMYLEILNDNMVGYANISSIDMLDHLFETYGNITAFDLEINFEHMRQAWDPQHPVETLFKQIQDCANYSEAEGVLIGHPQQINVGYAKIFATGHFMSACRRWNEKLTVEKTCTQFKSHFATAADRCVVAALTQANSRLAKQLEDNSTKLRELKALLNKERCEKRGQRSFNPSPRNYGWTHGYKVGSTHTSLTCKLPKPGHKSEATRAVNMGGSHANR
jgi:hypothetical protein